MQLEGVARSEQILGVTIARVIGVAGSGQQKSSIVGVFFSVACLCFSTIRARNTSLQRCPEHELL
jgi:hypothetical protein